MISAMREKGFLADPRIGEAFAAVPRHLFTPEVSIEEAYDAFKVVATRHGTDGATTSSVSAAHIQAMMLEQAAIQPGHRVLEVGSGGYNAAWVAELVGRTGNVTTVDLDPVVADRASRLLDATGYGRVSVVRRDAEHGVPEGAPYDRILVTAGAWDIPPAWQDQLAAGGRLVVPLRMRGLTRSIALTTMEDRLSGFDYQLCGFVPVRGEGGYDEPRVELAPGVRLLLDDHRGALDERGLRTALTEPAVQCWTGVTVAGMEPFDELHLWLASQLDGFARLSADATAIEDGWVDRWARVGAATLAAGGSLAYLAPIRPVQGERYEFGVRGHGPRAQQLAATLVAHVQEWDEQHREHSAQIIVYPAGAALPSEVIRGHRSDRAQEAHPDRAGVGELPVGGFSSGSPRAVLTTGRGVVIAAPLLTAERG
jgi:protein-L-isoaspartate(D-aspartate) O-methyltransferase